MIEIESGGLKTLLSHAAADLGPIDPYWSTPEIEKQFSVPASVLIFALKAVDESTNEPFWYI